MSKYEYRKSEKKYYLPKEEPTLIQIPSYTFLTIKGIGNPNGEVFSKKIEALFTLAYTIKMLPNKGINPLGYFDYVVFPLEGVWDLTDEGKKNEQFSKDQLIYTLMIRQPDFVDQDLFNLSLDMAKKKKTNLNLNEVRLESIEDGLCVQMMHIGSFDHEQRSFDVMNSFIEEHQLKKRMMTHREIYLSNFLTTEKSKLKTVLRYFVTK
ncbi:MAG: GyrI-like domain-containing protein [Bacillota bacterium]